MKKNNTAQKTALEVGKITKALKEGTEKTLQSLIKEALDDVINADDEEKEEDAPIEDDSYEVEDVETEVEPEEPAEEETPADEEPAEEEGEEAAEPEEADAEADDEWADLEDYKVGDDDYDLTNVDGDIALKVYNKLGDDDQIFVKKQDDGTFEVKDDETGAEFVVELEPEGEDADADEEPVDVDVELSDDDEDAEIELDLDDEDGIDDEDETLNEDLGYTDSYQKDVMPGLKMNEPANPKATYSMDDVPEGNKKPWAGKHKEPDYTETHTDLAEGKCCEKCGKKECDCELEEAAQTVATQPVRKTTKSVHGKIRPNNGEEVKKVDSPLTESKARKILEAAKAIQAENKQYKSMIDNIKNEVTALKQGLYEAAILNKNYGKLVTLLVNETTTKDEKRQIVERFKSVKTINEGKQLYDTIKTELNESTRNNAKIQLDEQISATSSKTINETPIYSGENPSINLMNRMDNLGRYNVRLDEKKQYQAKNEGMDLINRMNKIR